MSKEAPIIVGLDIGTTKIAVIAGRRNENGKIEILGFGRSKSIGVKNGEVLNIQRTIASISEALNKCVESNAQLEIEEVYVGIAGHHIKSIPARGDLVRENAENEITFEEIQTLINNQKKMYIPPGDQIIDVIPQEFQVDNYKNIKEFPIGYRGVKVGANFHVITGNINSIKNINRAVVQSSLKTADLVLQPLASASAVMNEFDYEAGVVILDIGGGTSDLAIFSDGILTHTAVIPFGGEEITEDIRRTLGVLKNQAEQLKIQFGSTLPSHANPNAFINIPGVRGLAPKQISVRTLAEIIQYKVEKILHTVNSHISECGIDINSLQGGLIITGGGSQLKHIDLLAGMITGMQVRIGYPIEHLTSTHSNELKSPAYSTCIGLILKGNNDFMTNQMNSQKTKVAEKSQEDASIIKENMPNGKTKANIGMGQGSVNARKFELWNYIKHGVKEIFINDDKTY